MVLSNAERQKRYRRRLKARAAAGVTSEMVVRATKLMYEFVCEQYQDPADWDKFLGDARKRGGAGSWQEMVPSDVENDYAEFGSDAGLMRTVAAVGHSVLHPPKG